MLALYLDRTVIVKMNEACTPAQICVRILALISLIDLFLRGRGRRYQVVDIFMTLMVIVLPTIGPVELTCFATVYPLQRVRGTFPVVVHLSCIHVSKSTFIPGVP